MLPFWAFEAKLQYEFTGEIGKKDKSGRVVDWKCLPWVKSTKQFMSQNEVPMQVYANYDYRHDFVHTLKPGTKIQDSVKNLNSRHHNSLYRQPRMPRYLAWDFVMRNISQQEEEQVTEQLKRDHPGCDVRNVKIRLFVVPNTSFIVYLPFYVVDYIYRENINIHGERHPNYFYAMVSGLGTTSLFPIFCGKTFSALL